MKKNIATSIILTTLLTNMYAEINTNSEINATYSTPDTASSHTNLFMSDLNHSVSNVQIDEQTAKAISEVENKAIAKAQSKKIRTIAEAEAIKAKTIAKATKEKAIIAANAIKSQTITEIDAKTIAEINITKTKAKLAKNQAISTAKAVKSEAENIYKQTISMADAAIKASLEELNMSPKTDSSKTDSSKTDSPKTDSPKIDSPKIESNTESEGEDSGAKSDIDTLLKDKHITFKKGSISLTEQGQETVIELADILKKYPDINVEIAGYTDSDGSKTLNQQLSQSRVDTIRELLVTTQGIMPDRLVAKGYGEEHPIVPNTSRSNKEKNRRVEINIIQK